MHCVFQVVIEESKTGPLIILLKDIERFGTGNTESYVTLKTKLDMLPPGVLVIGSYTQADNSKEKVYFHGAVFLIYYIGSYIYHAKSSIHL